MQSSAYCFGKQHTTFRQIHKFNNVGRDDLSRLVYVFPLKYYELCIVGEKV